MSNVTARIHDLIARKQRLYRRPWAEWTPDTEARIANLNKLIEEAYGDKRRERAQGGQASK